MNIRQIFIGFGLIVLSVLAVACANGVSIASSNGVAPYSPEVARGAELYVNFACVQCHGLGGQGRDLIPTSGPSLISTDFKKAFPKRPEVDETLAQLIKNGIIVDDNRVASMPAWNGIIPDDDLAEIVAYIRAGLPNLQIPISKAATGEQSYTAFACIQCHGQLGKGGNINQAAVSDEHRVIPTLGGPAFRRRLGTKETVRDIVLHGRLVEGGRPGVVYMPAWGRIGTADQIDQLVNYIWSFDSDSAP